MRRLLVVDDETDVLDFVERVFRRQYLIVRAESVAAAEAALAGGDFAVIITDGRMPRGSGHELLLSARASHPGAVRVLLSGYTAEGEDAGAADVRLPKPIDAEALREAVAEAAARRAGATE